MPTLVGGSSGGGSGIANGETRVAALESAGGFSGQSLAVVDDIPPFTSGASTLTEVTGSLTPTITVPASGRIKVEAFTPWLAGDVANSAPVLGIYEALVTSGVAGAFSIVTSAVWANVTAGKGVPVMVARPLARTPGNQYQYKLQVFAFTGASKPSVSNLGVGGSTYIEITAR
jgi:hypothetical protein